MRNPVFLVITLLMGLVSASSMAQTAITYQGELLDDSGPANGTVAMEFMLYDDEAGTDLLGTDGPRPVEVNDGLFQVELDFGSVYSDPPVYLQIVVDGTPLLDLQKLAPAPAAVSAATASSAATAVTADSASSVPWSGVTDAPGFWRLGGNAGTDPGIDYLGTTDETAFALRVNDQEALRIIPSTDAINSSSPNLIGGHAVNALDEGTDNDPPIIGAVVGGGGVSDNPNIVGEDYATVGGGLGNTASGRTATISGGTGNTATGLQSTIGGGFENTVSGFRPTVGGGIGNTAFQNGTVGGGRDNTASGIGATVGGGRNNEANGGDATVGGGDNNTASDEGATVGGGLDNTASGDFSTVGGGLDNTASKPFATVSGNSNTASGINATVSGGKLNTASDRFATVPGGLGNCAGGLASMAMGKRAKVRPGSDPNDDSACDSLPSYPGGDGDTGTFVWADDSSSFSFISTGSNQFLVRAAGGAGIGTNAPAAQLHVQDAVCCSDFDAGDHVALIDNASTQDGADVLALKVAKDNPDVQANFITFLDASGQVGEIEGDGSGGIQLDSAGADFAERLPKANAAAELPPGSVVGLSNGRVDLTTTGAERAMVISTAAIVNGNRPPEERADEYVSVAFVGQVPVKVHGPVSAGDVLVPSGDNDGTAMVADVTDPASLNLDLVIGTAIESSNRAGIDKVIALVGLPQGGVTEGVVSGLNERITALESENVRLREKVKRNAEMARRNADLEARLTALEEVLFEQRRVAEGQ